MKEETSRIHLILFKALWGPDLAKEHRTPNRISPRGNGETVLVLCDQVQDCHEKNICPRPLGTMIRVQNEQLGIYMRTKSGNSESLCRHLLGSARSIASLKADAASLISMPHRNREIIINHDPPNLPTDLPMDLHMQPFLLFVLIVEFYMNQFKINISPCFPNDLQLFFYFSLCLQR